MIYVESYLNSNEAKWIQEDNSFGHKKIGQTMCVKDSLVTDYIQQAVLSKLSRKHSESGDNSKDKQIYQKFDFVRFN